MVWCVRKQAAVKWRTSQTQGQANHMSFATACFLAISSRNYTLLLKLSRLEFSLCIVLPSSNPEKKNITDIPCLLWEKLLLQDATFWWKSVCHIQQIMWLLPHSLDTGQSFRGRLMEVKSALTRCMKRESVTHVLYVQHIGKSIIYYPALPTERKSSSFVSCTQHLQEIRI